MIPEFTTENISNHDPQPTLADAKKAMQLLSKIKDKKEKKKHKKHKKDKK